MKGVGVSYGAVSVLNAIPCGIGSTIGIELKTRAEFSESPSTSIELVGRPGMSTLLAETCVKRTLEHIGKDPGMQFSLRIESEIPPSRGLKSSSSVCNAVISSVLDFFGIVWDPMETVRLGVECAKECGVTITGAFDDACGCHLGGLVVTDNTECRLLSRRQIPKYDVVVCIPENEIPKSRVSAEKYRELKDTFEALAHRIDDDPLKVLTENGSIVCGLSGADGSLAEKAMGLGALAAGVTGTGPAVAAICEPGTGRKIADSLGCSTVVSSVRTDISFSGGQVGGSVAVPSSKSHTHRAVILSALSGGPCEVSSPLLSFDTRATMDAMRSMGADIEEHGSSLTVRTGKLHAPDRTVDVGNSGTTLRLMSGISALFDSETVLTGDESIRRRPMGPLLDSLSGCGVRCSSENGKAPLNIRGPVTEDRITVDGSTSSQFVSSVMMMSPLIGKPVDIQLTGKTVSRPYIEITLRMMRLFGADITETETGFHVEPGPYRPYDYTVPADFSSAAFPLVAGALGGSVSVSNLDFDDPQGDKRIIDILRDAGCSVTVDGDTATCTKNGRPRSLEIDMSDIPDLFPIVCVLLSTAEGTSRLYGAPHLRFKESDRIALTERMLRTLGADITGTEDGCIINGVGKLHGGRIEHSGDHRLMMAAAVASLVADGPVTMNDDKCWNVSFPGFPEMMRSLGLRC